MPHSSLQACTQVPLSCLLAALAFAALQTAAQQRRTHVHMALVEAAPGSQALAGGALRGAVLPVAHAEALLLEEAVHAMLHSTMHQLAAKDC